MSRFSWNKQVEENKGKDDPAFTLLSKGRVIALTLFLIFLIAGSALEISYWFSATEH